jgi:hypothetical protein
MQSLIIRQLVFGPLAGQTAEMSLDESSWKVRFSIGSTV